MKRGTIILEFDEISPEATERFRQIFVDLIASGGLNIRNGNTTLHFDQNGVMQMVDVYEKRWLKRKASPA